MLRVFLFLICLIQFLYAVELKDKAQKAFVEGDYENALILYDSLAISSEGAASDNARVMKAVIYEEYLGQLDSAQLIYQKLLHESPQSRSAKRWKRRLDKIEMLMPEKEVYASYRMTLMSREKASQKVGKLQSLFDKYPNFSKREELGRLLITQQNDLRNFGKALAVMEELRRKGAVFKKEVYKSAQVNAWREKITFLGWILVGVVLIGSLFLIKKVDKREVLGQFIKLLLAWIVITTIYLLAYYLHFSKDSNNPFIWHAPILLMGLMVIPILWLSLSSAFFKSAKLFYPLGLVPSLLLIFLLYHGFLYYQKQPMVLMDTFEDRMGEFFGLEKEDIKDGKN